MSFRCDLCNEHQEAGTSPVRQVTEQRRKVYPERRGNTVSPTGTPTTKVIDVGGDGWEIVKEVEICSKCSEQFVKNE